MPKSPLLFYRFPPKAVFGKFISENLVGNELLEDRAAVAQRRLPGGIKILVGDAAEIDLGEGPLPISAQSTFG